MSSESIWVFAYGSLIWNPGFQFSKLFVGHIKGYSRRFYQGSDQHRGSPQMLGRVATLIEEEKGSTWGIAFQIEDREKALEYLKQRESSIGGYTTITTIFYPKDQKYHPFDTLVYIALSNNRLFLGPSPIEKIAQDIAFSKGFCGYNVEYLAKLVAFMRIELPHICDEHLYELETKVKHILNCENQFQLLKYFQDSIDSWLETDMFDQMENEEDNFDLSEIIKPPPRGYKFVNSITTLPLRCVTKY